MKNNHIYVCELYEAYIINFSKQLYNHKNNNFVCIKTNFNNTTGNILIYLSKQNLIFHQIAHN